MHCRFVLLSALFLAFGLAGCAGGPVRQVEPSSPGTETIAILATNDLHGAVAQAPLLAGYVHALRQEWGSSLLWLDGGDSLTGTLESEADGGASMVACLNSAGLDATAAGDRDLADPAFAARATEAHFPFLAANLPGYPGVGSSHIFRAGSMRVGVLGLTSIELSGSRASVQQKKLPFEWAPLAQPLADAVVREAKRLRDDGAQLVVAVAHVGQRCDPGAAPPLHAIRKPGDYLGACDRGDELSRLLGGLPPGTLDAVVSGSSHTIVHHWISGVPVVQAGRSGAYLNVLYLVYDWNHRQPLPERSRIEGPVAVTTRPFHGASIDRDPQAAEIVQGAETRSSPARELTIAKTGAPLEYSRTSESGMGDLVADAARAAMQADLALINPGAIRSGLPKGDIHYGDLYQALPYDARLVTVELTGEELKTLARIASNGSRGIMEFSGLHLRLLEPDADAKASDLNGDKRIEPWEVNRLLEATLEDDTPIQTKKKYRLATLDFLARGGDDFAWFFGRLPDDRFSKTPGPELRQAVRDYLALVGKAGAVNPPSEPRYHFEKAKAKASHRSHRKRHRK
jgi:5'-nucleotidase